MHQRFVDVTVLFGPPTLKEVKGVRNSVQTFMDASRTIVNKDKTNIFFFNYLEAIHMHLTRSLGFKMEPLPFKYLGVPLVSYFNQVLTWEDLLERT